MNILGTYDDKADEVEASSDDNNDKYEKDKNDNYEDTLGTGNEDDGAYDDM